MSAAGDRVAYGFLYVISVSVVAAGVIIAGMTTGWIGKLFGGWVATSGLLIMAGTAINATRKRPLPPPPPPQH